MYIIKSHNLPFSSFDIFEDTCSEDIEKLIEFVRKTFEEEISLEPTTIKRKDNWLYLNDSNEKFLEIVKLNTI